MGRTNIPVSENTRRELRILKAEEDHSSYDDLLQEMVSDRRGE